MRVVWFSILLISFNSFAINITDLEFNGFMTIGAQKANISEQDSSGNDIKYNGSHDNVTYDDETKAGLSATALLSDNYRGKIQFLAEQGETGFNAVLDIAQLSFDYNSNTYVRVGRFRLPMWLVSEYVQVGVLYPWQRPPRAVYDKNPINSMNGGMITFHKMVGDFNVSLDTFLGGEKQTVENQGSDVEIDARNVYGANLMISNEKFTFKLAQLYAYMEGYVWSDAQVSAGPPPVFGKARLDLNLEHVQMTSVGVKADVNNILFMSEYIDFNTENANFEKASAYYVTLGYNFRKLRVMPYVTISKDLEREAELYPDGEETVSVGANIKLNDNAVWKIEVTQAEYLETDSAASALLGGNRRGTSFNGDPGKKITLLSGSFNMVF